MRRVDSLEKALMLGGIGGRRRRGQQRMRWLDGITDSMDMRFEWTPGVGGQGGLACCDSWGHKESDTTEQLNWTELKDTDARYGGNNFELQGGNMVNMNTFLTQDILLMVCFFFLTEYYWFKTYPYVFYSVTQLMSPCEVVRDENWSRVHYTTYV